MDYLAAFDRVRHRGLLYKLRSIGAGGQFLSIVSQFLSDRRQRERFDGQVSVKVDVVSWVPQGSVLGQLLLYCMQLYLHCSPPISLTLLITILWAMRMILRSMQSFLGRFRVLK